MAEFLGDIAFMFEVLVLGVGLVILHFNKKDPSSYLKWAGKILTTVAVLGMLCTGYFYMKYWFAGEFDSAHHMGSGQTMMGRMMPGMGGPRHMMMTPSMMENMKMHMKNEVGNCLSDMSGKMMDEATKDHIQSCLVDKFKAN
jgi:hypothetical protein